MKSNIWVLGDPHIFGETCWQQAVAKKMISYIKNHPLNNKDTEVIITGDLTDKFKSLPPTYDLVMEFLSAFNVKAIHLLVGNHDVDKMSGHESAITKGKGQAISYSYASKIFSNCNIYEYPSSVDIAGLKVLMLPYYKAPSHCLDDYNDPVTFYKKWPELSDIKFDFVVGHVIDSSSGLPAINCVDLKSLLKSNPMIILGHLHSGSMPGENKIHYTGSMYGLKVDETGPHYEMIYKEGIWSAALLPKFSEMISIKYGEALPPSVFEGAVPVYTIYNCSSEDKARKLYGDSVYIRKTISGWEQLQKNNELDIDSDIRSFSFLSKEKLLEEFEKELYNQTERIAIEDIPLSLKALEIVKSLQPKK